MDQVTGGYDEQLDAAIQHVVDLLEQLPATVFRLAGEALSSTLTAVDQMCARGAAARFTFTGEAETRREIASSQAGSVRQWIAERCPSLEDSEVGTLARA